MLANEKQAARISTITIISLTILKKIIRLSTNNPSNIKNQSQLKL